MARQIFIVDAHIVDANGSFNYLNGYPKRFDSNSYDGDIDKSQRRAEGDMYETYGAMLKIDTRQQQTVVLQTADGFQIDRKSVGQLQDPQPQPAPEPEET